MARRKAGSPPSYRHHKPSGQAVVTVDGTDHYLGRFGSAESRKRYSRVIDDWHDRQEAPITAPAVAAGDGCPSVNALILAYVRHAAEYYRPTEEGENKEVGCIRDALRLVQRLHGRSPAARFGPKALKSV